MSRMKPKFFLLIIPVLLIGIVLLAPNKKKKFERTDYCAVVMINDVTYVEYWFPNRNELNIFVAQMPQYQRTTNYNPLEDYLIFKRTGGRGIYQVRLSAAPPIIDLPNGVVIAAYDLSKSSGKDY